MDPINVKGNWTGLPHIDEVTPVSDTDEACLQEIRSVLEKHGALSRFGLTLMHQHFPIQDDEVLVESCDPISRTLTSRPVNVAELVGVSSVQTSWRLDTGEAMMKCVDVCKRDGGNHTADHSVTR